MSKTGWIVIAIIVVLVIALFLYMQKQKKKQEEAMAETLAAANSGGGASKGTFADALATFLPIAINAYQTNQAAKDAAKVTAEHSANPGTKAMVSSTSNMGASSTNKAMMGVFGDNPTIGPARQTVKCLGLFGQALYYGPAPCKDGYSQK